MSKSKEKKFVSYSIPISENLSECLEQRITILKKLGREKVSKQKWVESAIKEKMEADKSKKNSIPKERHLSIKIEEKIFSELSKQVSKIGKFRASFSKKKYILEAIYEKLEKEEQEAESLMLSIHQDLENQS